MDGHKQRQALSAAERSLEHLAAGRGSEARRAALRADELDQVGVFGKLSTAIGVVAEDLERSGRTSAEHLRALEDAVGPGPLAALLDPLRPLAGGE